MFPNTDVTILYHGALHLILLNVNKFYKYFGALHLIFKSGRAA